MVSSPDLEELVTAFAGRELLAFVAKPGCKRPHTLIRRSTLKTAKFNRLKSAMALGSLLVVASGTVLCGCATTVTPNAGSSLASTDVSSPGEASPVQPAPEAAPKGPRPSLTMPCSEFYALPSEDLMLATTSALFTSEFAATLAEDALWDLTNNVSYLCGEATSDAPIAGPIVQSALSSLGASWDDFALSLPVASTDAETSGVVFPGKVANWRVVSGEEFEDFWALYWSPPSDQSSCIAGLERSLIYSSATTESVTAYYTESSAHIAMVGCPFAVAMATRTDVWGTMLDSAPLVEGVPCVIGDNGTRDVCGTRAHDAVWLTHSFGGGNDTEAIAELLNAVVLAQ